MMRGKGLYGPVFGRHAGSRASHPLAHSAGNFASISGDGIVTGELYIDSVTGSADANDYGFSQPAGYGSFDPADWPELTLSELIATGSNTTSLSFVGDQQYPDVNVLLVNFAEFGDTRWTWNGLDGYSMGISSLLRQFFTDNFQESVTVNVSDGTLKQTSTVLDINAFLGEAITPYDVSRNFQNATSYTLNGAPSWLTLSGSLLVGTPLDETDTSGITVTASDGIQPDAVSNFFDANVENRIEIIYEGGGPVRAGEQFQLIYAPGGLTGSLSVTLGGEACTTVNVIDDNNLTAFAPLTGLVYDTVYSMVIE